MLVLINLIVVYHDDKKLQDGGGKKFLNILPLKKFLGIEFHAPVVSSNKTFSKIQLGQFCSFILNLLRAMFIPFSLTERERKGKSSTRECRGA